VIVALVTIPLRAVLLRPTWPTRTASTASHRGDVSAIVRTLALRLLVVAFGVGSLAAFRCVQHGAAGRGLSTELAAFALGLLGIGQVLGRLGNRRLANATSVRVRTVAIVGSEVVALGVVPSPVPLLTGLTLIVGAFRGMFTLLHATAITDRWGPAHYATLNRLLAVLTTTAMGLAPAAGRPSPPC
jgi:hypothetical protein